MAELEPAAFDRRLDADDGGPLVLDIRPEAAYDDWRIPGSVHLDVYDELQDDPESARETLAQLPDDEEIVTVCAAGVVSAAATRQLRELGYQARTLADGMAGWSRVHRHAPVDVDLAGTLVQVARPGTGCLSYVLVSDGEAAVVDPSRHAGAYEDVLSTHDADLVGVYDTHAHADHVSGGRSLADRHDVPYHLHPADAVALDAAPVADGDTFAVGDVTVSVLHTPGHSPGGVTYAVEDRALMTGDTLFHGSVGRVELGVEAGLEGTDVAENAATLHESLQRLLDRRGDPLVLPAHDPGTPDPPVTARLNTVRERTAALGLPRSAFIDRLATDVPDHPPNFERIKRINVGAEAASDADLADLELGPNRCAVD